MHSPLDTIYFPTLYSSMTCGHDTPRYLASYARLGPSHFSTSGTAMPLRAA